MADRRQLTAILVAALAATIAGAAGVAAQNYPSRPITVAVPFPAGGPSEALARVLAERMRGARDFGGLPAWLLRV